MSVRLRAAAWVWAVSLALWAVGPAYSQQSDGRQSTHGVKSIRALAVEEGVLLDGMMNEAVWEEAPVASGFLQKDPQEGLPATEPTEFRVLYSPTTLYIGVMAYDSNPAGILANERQRDGNLENDDYITIALDTFHDHRNSYHFTTNPLGTQKDALVTDEGNTTNENWDEKWTVSSRITDAGWTAVFAIPFKTIRVPESEDGLTFGLEIERLIRRKNESTSWVNYRRGFNVANVSQAGHLTGLEAIETGLRLRIKPYLLGGFSQQVRLQPTAPVGPGRLRTVTQDASDFGIEVMKYRITPSLTADFTWNTDFAQTEVDNQQINLDRFPLFFPERREFFQEGAGIFEFGIAENENRGAVTKLFHTRQIGLSPRRQPIPIVAGGRITGRVGGFGVGLMNVQTERYDPESILASNYSVARVKRDILGRSTIGAFFLNREKGGLDTFRSVYGAAVTAPPGSCQACMDYNRVAGADANFVFFRHFNVGGFVGKSYQPRLEGSEGEDWSTAAVVRWDSDQFNIETSYHTVSRNFRDDLGFIPRRDQRLIAPQLAFRPRIDGDLIRQIILRYRIDYTMNTDNRLETRIGHAAFEVNFQDGGVFGWVPHTRFDTFYQPFNLRQGVVVVPEGSHSWWNNGLRYNLSPRRRISGQLINWAWHVGYYGKGTLHDFNFGPRIRVTDQLSTQVGYSVTRATFPTDDYCVVKDGDGCEFTDHLVNARINFNLNNRWLTSTTIQYNNADAFWGYNFRLNYIFRPGDDFFLIYNEGRQIDGPHGNILSGEKDRTIQAKLTYSFDF